jgi:GMP reductase|tara:strand:+ start:1583 stop:2638 length:1056 start_codon:yes stop_codon:yes gene_type:complete
MKIENDIKFDFSDVLIRPKRTVLTSRSEVSLTRRFTFPNSTSTWEGVPIIAANMDTTGTFNVMNVLSKHNMLTCLTKFYGPNDFKTPANMENKWKHGIISSGISDNDFTKLTEILTWRGDNMDSDNITWVCVDIANGYMQKIVDFCKKVRSAFNNIVLIAGNVATREMTEELIINGGVDIVKVGIGPGSACLTRLKTGVGMPQLSCIIECADAAHGAGGYIIADGGITCPGDMAKAFGGGADFVMMGGQFAGHDENPGEIVEENGEKFKLFYGMSSELAMNKHYGKMEKYRSSEGRVIKIKYKGSLEDTVLDYLGGLRSACTYINAKCIKYIPKCTTFVRVNNQLNLIYAK